MERGGSGEPRFWMLETIHEYAREQLDASGEGDELRSCHAEYYAALAEEAEPELRGAKQMVWLERLEVEHDNVRAALGWSLSASGSKEVGLRLASSLWRFWVTRCHLTEGRHWLDEVLEANSGATASLRAKVLSGAGTIAWRLGKYTEAAALHEQALNLYRQVEDTAGIAFSLNNMATQFSELGDQERAEMLFKQSLALYRQSGNKWGAALLLVNLGEIARLRADYELAGSLYEEGLSVYEEFSDKAGIANVLLNIGYVAGRLGDYDRATRLFARSLSLSRELGNKLGIALALSGLMGAAASEQQPEKAARLAGALEVLFDDLGSTFTSTDSGEYVRYLADSHSQLDDVTWEKARAEGRAMSLEQAIDYALEDHGE